MRKIALIACCKKKLGADEPEKLFRANEIYIGNSFKHALNEGVNKYGCDDYYIISAKHHLLDKNSLISYYDTTLNKMPVKERRIWAKEVIAELAEKFDLENDCFYIFGGGRYYEFLKDQLNCVVFDYANSNSIILDRPKAEYKNGGK